MKRNQLLMACLLLVLPLLLTTLLVAALELSLPNALSSPLLQKLPLLPSLFRSQFMQGLKFFLFDFHLFAILSKHSAEVVWGVYVSVSDTLLLLTAAWLYSSPVVHWKNFLSHQKTLLIFSALICWSALFDLWLSGCCTAGPDWWLNVVLLAKAYVSNPYLDTINWQGIYQKMTSISVLLRVLLYVSGLLMLRLCIRNARNA